MRKVADRFGVPKSTVGAHKKDCLGLGGEVSAASTDKSGRLPDAPELLLPERADGGSPFAGLTNPGDDDRTSPRRVVTAIVERRCVEMRAAGRAYVDIADELGIDEETAADVVERVLIRTSKGTDARADKARALDLERIDRLLSALWDRAMKPPESAGPDGEVTPDFAAQDKAVERITKLLERRAKLTGADVPTPAVAINIQHPAVKAELERGFAEFLKVALAALRPHPAALADFQRALRTYRDEKGIGGQ